MRGERMKKILTLLLVIAFLVGTFAAADVVSEADASFHGTNFTGDGALEENPGDPVPCGQGGTGGPPLPG